MADATTSQLQIHIDRILAGDRSARGDLISHARSRLHKLTRKMFLDFNRVRRWEDSEDVLQNAILRLDQALQAVELNSVEEFFRLAARQIRRELIDLARHYFGPQGLAANHASRTDREGPDPSGERDRLEVWTEFHEQAEALPAEERVVFELLWYHGMTQAEAASVLDVSLATVKRRWLAARLRMQEGLEDGEQPG